MMNEFKNKTVLITGVTSYMGYELAKYLLKRNAHVIGCGRQSVSDVFDKYPLFAKSNIKYYQVDFQKEIQVQSLFDKIGSQYSCLEYAFNGIGYPFKSLMTNMSLNEFDRVIKLNLYTIFLAIKYEVIFMRKNHKGFIVNLSSISGLRTNEKGISAYSASKFALNGFVRAAALEEAKNNIRINAICPGIMMSNQRKMYSTQELNIKYGEMHPLGRIAQANDILNLVLFLFSSKSEYITGTIISVDGGISAK